MTVCQYCAGGMDVPCCAKPIGLWFRCTREPDHDGPCVACGAGDHEHDLTGAAPDDLIIWNDNEEQPTD